MPGVIDYAVRYTRGQIRRHPHWLYVFGDNVMRSGHGGQAFEARGEPNAVGIPTKWAPSMDADAFFTDRALDNPDVTRAIDDAFERMRAHLLSGGTVVWPRDGVGTGLADLQNRAPRVQAYIQHRLLELYDVVDAPDLEE